MSGSQQGCVDWISPRPLAVMKVARIAVRRGVEEALRTGIGETQDEIAGWRVLKTQCTLFCVSGRARTPCCAVRCSAPGLRSTARARALRVPKRADVPLSQRLFGLLAACRQPPPESLRPSRMHRRRDGLNCARLHAPARCRFQGSSIHVFAARGPRPWFEASRPWEACRVLVYFVAPSRAQSILIIGVTGSLSS